MHRRRAARLITTLPALLAAAVCATVTAPASAQSWPDKTIRLVVPYPPGASTDAVGRIVGQAISGPLGQNIIVDNKGGASGSIGSAEVARAASDGYTFLLGTDASHAANYHLSSNPPYHPVRDFTPLTIVAMNPIVLVINPAVTPAKTLTELMAYVKANPDKGAYGSSGSGSPHHLAGELLKMKSGAPLVHVPYKGGGPAVNDLIGGTIPMVFSSLITVLPHIKSGRLHAVAMTNEQRYAELPNVPTMAETYPGAVMNSWLGFFAPAKLPAPIAQRLGGEIQKALKTPEVKSKLDAAGMVVVALDPVQSAALVAREFEERGQLIKAAGIQAQ